MKVDPFQANNLDIKNARSTHAGRYFCEALNEMGQTIRAVSLDVECKYGIFLSLDLAETRSPEIGCWNHCIVLKFEQRPSKTAALERLANIRAVGHLLTAILRLWNLEKSGGTTPYHLMARLNVKMVLQGMVFPL